MSRAGTAWRTGAVPLLQVRSSVRLTDKQNMMKWLLTFTQLLRREGKEYSLVR